MKKKIISLTVLLLTVITGAWADETPTLSTPLTIEATTAGKIRVTYPQPNMQFSMDGGDKQTLTQTTDIPVEVGHTVEFYGKGTTITCYYDSGQADRRTTITGIDGLTCRIYGNIMSLVDETGFAAATTLAANAFQGLFSGNTSLTDASQLFLPATALASGCYDKMFFGCTALTTAPALPATTLANGCYLQMFKGCTSLTTAPALPATTLDIYCYDGMFQGCTSLTATPVLPAATLVQNCYHEMFDGCTSLNSVICLATNISAAACTTYWLNGVPGAGKFATTNSSVWAGKGSENGIPTGWTTTHPLDEKTDNSGWISSNPGNNDITLIRTLKAGGWNTFSVPFGTAIPSGWTVKQLSGAYFYDGTRTLTLTFEDATSIVAGKPYLVKVGSDVVNPTFSGVTISSSTNATTIENVISFEPAINPTTLPTNEYKKSYLFVSGGDKLTWASSGSSMKGFRAYFHILDSSIANALAFTMDFSDATGIANCQLPNVNSGKADAWYDLQGRRVQQPVKKGIYVVNGKKYVIK